MIQSMKTFQTFIPGGMPLMTIYFAVSIIFIRQTNTWSRVYCPIVSLKLDLVSSMRALFKFIPSTQWAMIGLTTLQETLESTSSFTLSLVRVGFLPTFITFNFKSTSLTYSEQGLMRLNPGLSSLENLPKVYTNPTYSMQGYRRRWAANSHSSKSIRIGRREHCRICRYHHNNLNIARYMLQEHFACFENIVGGMMLDFSWAKLGSEH